MIFIRGDKIDESNIKVTFQHFTPLDKKYGLTEEQLKEGYLVDDIPEVEDIEGKAGQLYYNIPEQKCYWKYIEIKKEAPVTLKDVNDKVDLLMQLYLESEGLL